MAPRLLAAIFTANLAFAQTSLTVTLAGQSMIRSDLRQAAPAAVPVAKALLKGDVVFTNFEGAVAEAGQSTSEGRGFLVPPAALDALTAIGFNLLALADNHAFDLKVTGIQNTLREAESRGIVHAGTGNTLAEAAAPAYLHTPKGVVALIASCSGLITAGGMATANQPGVNELRIQAGGRANEATADLPGAAANAPNPEDRKRILESIRDARKQAALVVVYQHNHVFGNRSFSTIFTEGMAERLAPNPWLIRWTHEEIDAGADIVVMHGAPLLHGVEIYKGKPILYDLGNFIYNLPPYLSYIDEPMSWESAVAYVEFQGRNLQSVTFRPIVLNYVGEGQPEIHDLYASNPFLHTRGLPAPATGARAGYILERVAEFSKPFGTKFEIKGDRAEIRVKP